MPDDVLRRLPARAAQAKAGEALAPLGVREAHQRMAVEPQQIEDDVCHGGALEQPLRRRFFSSEKSQERIAWAERQIQERGGLLILLARFIPAGRTVVTFSSGWLEMPWRRFIVYDVLAGFVWASYAALLGYFGGKAFERQPWKGLVLAFGIALLVTGVVEGVRWLRRRGRG